MWACFSFRHLVVYLAACSNRCLMSGPRWVNPYPRKTLNTVMNEDIWPRRSEHHIEQRYINIVYPGAKLWTQKPLPLQITALRENFTITCQRSKDPLSFTNFQSSKMQFTNAVSLALSLFSASGLAAPGPESAWGTTATIQLANDQSGANADVAIPVDAVKRPVQELWGHTSIAENGLVFASSAQLVDFAQTVVCTITEDWPHLSTTLEAEGSYASLDHGRVVDLCAAQVMCTCEGI